MENMKFTFLLVTLVTIIYGSQCSKSQLKSGDINYFRNLGLSADNIEETLRHLDIPSVQYRLENNVIPISYRIFMRPVLEESAVFEKFTSPSEIYITVNCTTEGNTNRIVMHQRGLKIKEDKVTVKHATTGDLGISSHSYDVEKDFYIIETQKSFALGDQLIIYIPYTAKVSQDTQDGLYLGHYVDPVSNITKYLATTQFQPYHARTAFPMFDEPIMKATFQVSIARLNGKYHSLSNMEIENTEPDTENEGWEWDHYQKTVLMSSYLLCMIVSDFGNETYIDSSNRTVATWAPKHDIDAKGGVYGAETGAKLLEYYEDQYNMSYPLSKLDAAALPQFAAGAMENFGLVTYRYNYLVWIPGEGTEAERRKVTQVLAHEIVHQWFGNIVTGAWWSEIWLHEGFARYFQFWGMNATIPEFHVIEAFVHDATQLAMTFDQGPLTHPVHNSALSPYDIDTVFSRISYEKGASMLNMLEGFLTRPVFETGIFNIYLQNMQWKSAVQDDLLESLQAAVEQHKATHHLPTGVTVKDIMNEWTLTTGFPLVRVNINDNQTISITQQKFMRNSKATKVEGLWWVPVKIVTADNPTYENKIPDLWIPNNVSAKQHSSDKLNTDKWLMINPDASGYYRVLYDTKLTELLREQLMTDHSVISSISRSQLFDDYFNLAFAQYISIDTTLELTQYLKTESASNVWTTVFTHLKPMFNRFTQNNESLSVFKEYFLRHIEGALNIIGVKQTPQEKGINVTLRAQLLDMACQLDMPSCVEYAKELLATWKGNAEINPFPVDIQSSMYCAAVAASTDKADWDFILQKFHGAKRDTQKSFLLNALACSKDSATLSSLLELSLTNSTLTQYTSAILTRVGINPRGRDLVYKFAKDKLISTHITPQIFASTISTLSGYWNDIKNINELKIFIEANKNALEPVNASLETSLQNIQSCIDWWGLFGNRMQTWLHLSLKPVEEDNTTPRPSSAHLTIAGSTVLLVSLIVAYF